MSCPRGISGVPLSACLHTTTAPGVGKKPATKPTPPTVTLGPRHPAKASAERARCVKTASVPHTSSSTSAAPKINLKDAYSPCCTSRSCDHEEKRRCPCCDDPDPEWCDCSYCEVCSTVYLWHCRCCPYACNDSHECLRTNGEVTDAFNDDFKEDVIPVTKLSDEIDGKSVEDVIPVT